MAAPTGSNKQYSTPRDTLLVAGRSQAAQLILPTSKIGIYSPPIILSTSQYTLRVDPVSGNDAYTRAQVLSDPQTYAWKTVIRALSGLSASVWTWNSSNPSEAAQAGDVVLVEPGVSSVDSTGLTSQSQHIHVFANNGTASNPIIIKARYPAAFLSDIQDGLRSKIQHVGGHATLASTNGDYVYFDGIYFDEANAYNNSEALCDIGIGTRGGYVNCHFTGIPGTSDPNHNITQLLGSGRSATPAVQKLILNNRFSNMQRPDGEGFALIQYDHQDLFVLHNHVDSTVDKGIYFKGINDTPSQYWNNNRGGILAFNWIPYTIGESIGFSVHNYLAPKDTTLVYQNLITSIRMRSQILAGMTEGISIINNTFTGRHRALTGIGMRGLYADTDTAIGIYPGRNGVWRNNAYAFGIDSLGSDPFGSYEAMAWNWSGRRLSDFPETGMEIDRNMYAEFDTALDYVDFDGLGDFAEWTGNTPFDVNSSYTASAAGWFTDAANLDYSLPSASALKTVNGGVGQDYLQRLGGLVTAGIDVGAYITGIAEKPGLLNGVNYSWHWLNQVIPRDNG